VGGRSDGDGGFDGGVWVVAVDGDVVGGEIVDAADVGIEDEPGRRAVIAREEELHLFDVVGVDVGVAEGVDEGADVEAGDVGDHVGEDGVRGDVEGHAEEEVGGTLVELAGECGGAALLGRGDVELEEEVAGGKGHAFEFADVPGADDVTA